MQVVRLKPYLRAMKSMRMNDDAMRAIEREILLAPADHPMIRGLRGVRKARFARPGTGKSGGGRAIYFVAFGRGQLSMLTAYAKNVQEGLTSADRRAILRILDELFGRETK